MNVVKVADLKNNLSRHLARVRRGTEITVLDRETPIARIVPFVHGGRTQATTGREDSASAERIADLTRQGVIAPGDSQAVATWFEEHPPVPRAPGSPSALSVLLQMRRESSR